MDQRVAVVTGASSGIGEATALALARAGLRVYGAARRTERMARLASRGVQAVALDVTDHDSCQALVEQVTGAAGRIDVLVNNAGYGSYGAVEDVPLAEARRQFEVNLFGLADLVQLVVPVMREQGSGTIVNVSSMGGKVYTPFGAWYHATKHALEGFSDSLRLELSPFGIRVVIVEPGGIKTDWGSIAADNLDATSRSGAYAEQAGKVADAMRRTYAGRMLSGPGVVAKAVVRAATAARPRTRYAVGLGAKPLIFARRILPDRVFDALARRIIG